MGLIPGMENINIWALGQQSANIVIYVVGGILAAGVVWLGWHPFRFKIKCIYWEVYGSSRDGVFSITNLKKNSFRWNKERNAWIPLYPLFTKKQVQPFDSEYIYPKNKVYAYKFNDEYIPCRHNIAGEDELRGNLQMVPHSVRAWQSYQHKRHELEFASGVFERNKMFIMTILVVIALCALVGFTFWLIFQFMAPTKESLDGFTAVMQRIAENQIPSK